MVSIAVETACQDGPLISRMGEPLRGSVTKAASGALSSALGKAGEDRPQLGRGTNEHAHLAGTSCRQRAGTEGKDLVRHAAQQRQALRQTQKWLGGTGLFHRRNDQIEFRPAGPIDADGADRIRAGKPASRPAKLR